MRLPGDATLIVMTGGAEVPAPVIAGLVEAWRTAGLPIIIITPAAPSADAPTAPGEIRLAAGRGLATRIEACLAALSVTTLVFCGNLPEKAGFALVHHAIGLGYRSFVIRDATTDEPGGGEAQALSDRPIAASANEALAAAALAGMNRRRKAARH
jgi:nicotinamidase-related amidase